MINLKRNCQSVPGAAGAAAGATFTQDLLLVRDHLGYLQQQLQEHFGTFFRNVPCTPDPSTLASPDLLGCRLSSFSDKARSGVTQDCSWNPGSLNVIQA